jgi:glycosyltransferase involved in cell wall biosynthesis
VNAHHPAVDRSEAAADRVASQHDANSPASSEAIRESRQVAPAGEPMVTAIVVTYNHAPYIRQAVESVLQQRTDFDVEVIISEDCSTDDTRRIVLELQDRHPASIRVILSERNQNDNDVLTRAWAVARGRYIAYLDGDDFWSDPGKLQKQVRLLEQHPEVFICGHSVRVIDGNGETLSDNKFATREDRFLSPEDLAWGYCFPWLSILFRNNGHIPPAAEFNTVFNADFYLYHYFSRWGGGFVSAEVMGVYRSHAGGAWSGIDDRRAVDHVTATLWRVPHALSPDLKAIGYAALLWHTLHEDYSRTRRVKNGVRSAIMILLTLRWRSFRYLVGKIADVVRPQRLGAGKLN